MRKLSIEQNSDMPKVILDTEKNLFEISGVSRLADAAAFCKEIIRWFEANLMYPGTVQSLSDPVVVNFNFE